VKDNPALKCFSVVVKQFVDKGLSNVSVGGEGRCIFHVCLLSFSCPPMVFKEVPVRRVTFMKCLSCLTANAPATISPCGPILLLFTNYLRPFAVLFVDIRCSSVISRVVLYVGKPECVCCICCLCLQHAGWNFFRTFVDSALIFLGTRACVRR